MEEAISELLKFSSKILTLGNPITDDRIERFEKSYGLELPLDFRLLLSRYNGIDLMGTEIYGFYEDLANSLEDTYQFEHFKVVVPQWTHLLPFSPDGGGNFYCLDLSKSSGDECPIIFWVSNFTYSESDLPEIVNENLSKWIKEVMIKWTLEDYDYDGNER